MKKYLAIVEQAPDGTFGAYAPDLPGCGIAGAKDRSDALASLRTAIEMHIEGLIEDGLPVPEPTVAPDYVEVAAA